jgi:predicted nucleic acid-binding Zn ribbon protein
MDKRRTQSKSKPQTEPHSALDVLQSMLEKGNSPLSQDFKRYRLKLDWGRVVGDRLAEKCSPVGFSNGIVYIWVVNSTWMNQLFFVRKEILKKINTYGGRHWVKDIRFTLDRKDVPKEAACSTDPQADLESSSPNEGGEPRRDQ